MLSACNSTDLWLYFHQFFIKKYNPIFFLQGFDEYMNLVLDDAEEVSVKKNSRKQLGEWQYFELGYFCGHKFSILVDIQYMLIFQLALKSLLLFFLTREDSLKRRQHNTDDEYVCPYSLSVYSMTTGTNSTLISVCSSCRGKWLPKLMSPNWLCILCCSTWHTDSLWSLAFLMLQC